MQQAEKYNFDTVFGDHAASSRATAPRVKKRFSPEEVEEIRLAAHADGVASEEAKAAQSCAKALGACADTLANLFEHRESIERRHKAQALELALLTARKIARKALEIHPEEEIVSLVRECLSKLPGEPRVVVTLSEQLKGSLETQLLEMAEDQSFGGKILVRDSAAMTGADCAVEWAEGGVENSSEKLAQTIEELVHSRLNMDNPCPDQGDLFSCARVESLSGEVSALDATATHTSQQETS